MPTYEMINLGWEVWVNGNSNFSWKFDKGGPISLRWMQGNVCATRDQAPPGTDIPMRQCLLAMYDPSLLQPPAGITDTTSQTQIGNHGFAQHFWSGIMKTRNDDCQILMIDRTWDPPVSVPSNQIEFLVASQAIAWDAAHGVYAPANPSDLLDVELTINIGYQVG